MLHAMGQRKTSLYRRYIGRRNQEDGRVSMEDEITSTLLGPLAFLPKRDSAYFWYHLLKSGCKRTIADTPPESADIQLWPRRHGIEPDMHVVLNWPDGHAHTLLIELKWTAPLSGDDQLYRQWQEYLTDSERESATHLFIGKECSCAHAAKAWDDVWDGALVTQTWNQVLSFVHQQRQSADMPDSLACWSDLVAITLDKMGIQPFCGFSELPQIIETDTTYPIFFSGLQGLDDALSEYPAASDNTQPYRFHSH